MMMMIIPIYDVHAVVKMPVNSSATDTLQSDSASSKSWFDGGDDAVDNDNNNDNDGDTLTMPELVGIAFAHAAHTTVIIDTVVSIIPDNNNDDGNDGDDVDDTS